jgi:hypothetical protein
MSEKKELLTTNRKALTLNLDERKYGTFAEIGAGQEVASFSRPAAPPARSPRRSRPTT